VKQSTWKNAGASPNLHCLVHTTVENRERPVAALVCSEDPGAYAMGCLGMSTLVEELDRCLEHPDSLPRNAAHAACASGWAAFLTTHQILYTESIRQ
jgi:hypothetical protein